VSLSLYRKYRPETFTEVTGQEHVETTLKNAVQTGNFSHAYLFCGPRGTGKTTTARLLAKALLCEKAPTDHPDGTCEQCRAIADGIHPDVYELDAASRTGVENVREEIIGRVQFAPTRGSYKIYIIDEVHMLSTAAFNALLKTLEEPPTHVLFVLCTTDPHRVPPTIQSRCQRFDFHRLSEQEIIDRLAYISMCEGYATEPEALALIAQRSQGGMRDAIGSLEQIAVFGAGTVSYAAAESMLGEVSVEQLFSVATIIARRDVAACFAWVASFTQGGTDIAQFVRDLSGHIRNLYVASVLGDDPALAEIVEADDEQSARYLEQATLFGSSDRLAHVLVVLGDLSMQLRSAANARLALEIALTRMARPDSDLTLESLAARIAVLENRGFDERAAVVAADTAVAAGATASPSAPSPVSAVAADTPDPAPESAPAAFSTSDTPDPTPTAPESAPAAPDPAPAASDPAPSAPESAPAASETPDPTPIAFGVEVESVPDAPDASDPAPESASAPPVTTPDPAPDPALDAPDVELDSAPPVSASPSFGLEEARRLWLQVEKELAKKKHHSVAMLLGGSSARPDGKTGGLLVELPGDASFAKQNLERPENRELLAGIIERLHGTALSLAFILGTVMRRPTSASRGEGGSASELFTVETSDRAVEAVEAVEAVASAEPTPPEPPTPEPTPEPSPSTYVAPAPEPALEPTPQSPTPKAPDEDESVLRDIFAASFGAGVTIQEVSPED
jgi:DNA polymerase-3 subunit gamma/tau